MLIRVVFINESGMHDMTIENDYQTIKNLIGFDEAWNTPTITLDDVNYIVVCSDLGKIRHYPVSALSLHSLNRRKDRLEEPFIVGPIMITKFDGVDDFATLTDEDIERIESSMLNLEHAPEDWYNDILVFD